MKTQAVYQAFTSVTHRHNNIWFLISIVDFFPCLLMHKVLRFVKGQNYMF